MTAAHTQAGKTVHVASDDTSSDDDEHNTSNSFLLLCAHALIVLVLLSSLMEFDELKVALHAGSPWTSSPSSPTSVPY